jgi:hypothetical protein
MRALVGVVPGLVIGGVIGLLAGVASVEFGNVSAFEGLSGYVVGFVFVPPGALIGAIAGGAVLGSCGVSPPRG